MNEVDKATMALAEFVKKNGRHYKRECSFCGFELDFSLDDLNIHCPDCRATLFWAYDPSAQDIHLAMLYQGVLDSCDTEPNCDDDECSYRPGGE